MTFSALLTLGRSGKTAIKEADIWFSGQDKEGVTYFKYLRLTAFVLALSVIVIRSVKNTYQL